VVTPLGRCALVADLPVPKAGSDATDAAWQRIDVLLRTGRLAFDHRRILRDGVERARAKLEYSPLAPSFCDDEFTVVPAPARSARRGMNAGGQTPRAVVHAGS